MDNKKCNWKANKIAILTIQKVKNYGAVLQMYSLQKFLSDSGMTSRIVDLVRIDKKTSLLEEKSKLLAWLYTIILKLNDLRHYLINLFHFRDIRLKRLTSANKFFDDFNESYLKFTNKMHVSDLHDLNETFDIFISGSDQVWNTTFEFDISPYLLGFVNKDNKRVALSPSLGIDFINNEYIKDFKNNLNRFDSLSIREKIGKNVISKFIAKEIEVLFDPVFLYSKDEWNENFNLEDAIHKEPYVLCYSLGAADDVVLQIANRLSKKYDCQIIKIGRHRNDLYHPDNILIDWNVGPIEFLNLIYNSKSVITNSFHGTAISINFNKEFYSVLNKSNKRNTRIVNILESLKLTDRINYSASEYNTGNIDYTSVNSRLVKERNKLRTYIKKSVVS